MTKNLHELNPFKLDQGVLPPPILLLVKLLWIALLGKGYLLDLPQPFLPFLPLFDYIPGHLFQLVLQATFVIAGLLLLTNQKIRLSLILLFLVFFLAELSSKSYYSNGKLFALLLFLMAALSEKGKRPWLLQLQIILLYFGSGLNKVLDPDWRSGIYFDHWMKHVIHSSFYMKMATLLGDDLVAKLMSWGTIITEIIVLPILFSFKRWHPLGVWIGIVFHSVAFWMSGLSFGVFFPMMFICYLSFAVYSKNLCTMLPETGFIKWLYLRILKPMDFDNRFLLPSEEQPKNQDQHTHSIDFTNANFFQWWLNLRLILVNHPLTYLIICLLLCLPFLPNIFQHIATLLVIITFMPIYSSLRRWVLKGS